jgi:hypothetical protein
MQFLGLDMHFNKSVYLEENYYGDADYEKLNFLK